MIGESWVAANVTSDVEQPDGRQEKGQTDGRWPKYVQWPADNAAQDEQC